MTRALIIGKPERENTRATTTLSHEVGKFAATANRFRRGYEMMDLKPNIRDSGQPARLALLFGGSSSRRDKALMAGPPVVPPKKFRMAVDFGPRRTSS
jgi:hypothetical protein